MKKQKIMNWKNVFAFVAFLAIAYSSYLAIFYAAQPPLDFNAFRQTQTALTAYWFVQEGFRLAYETPVGGAPWSIPLEFPLYQLLVAALSGVSGASLDSVGRVVSFAFLIACLVPARSITIKLRLDKSIFYIFAALVFSSPIYVYWGRTFMIETTALFFAVLAIKYFVAALVDGFDKKKIALFATFISFSVLQKATTALPVLAILSLVYFFYEIKKWQVTRELAWGRLAGVVPICFVLPILIGFSWVAFTDYVKLMNPLGEGLTSSALSIWNWGTFEQRISRDLFYVFWVRIISTNLGGAIGLLFIALPFLGRNSYRLRAIVLVLFTLGIAPLFLFTNLHIVHSYYQSANIIFLLYALAVSLGGVILPRVGLATTLFALSLIMVSNYISLYSDYLPVIKRSFTKEDRNVAIGGILRREIPVGGQFVAFGNDWSSTLSYMAQRKSFTVPAWFKGYSDVVIDPERFVEKGKLGAVVSCSSQSSGATDLFKFASKKSWKIGEAHGCLVVTPQKSFLAEDASKVPCQGDIDRIAFEQPDGVPVISIAGWSTMYRTKADIPSSVFVVISGGDGNDRYIEALRVPRPEVNNRLGITEEEDAGFIALISANLPPGEYLINVAQTKNNRNEICQFDKKLLVPPCVFNGNIIQPKALPESR